MGFLKDYTPPRAGFLFPVCIRPLPAFNRVLHPLISSDGAQVKEESVVCLLSCCLLRFPDLDSFWAADSLIFFCGQRFFCRVACSLRRRAVRACFICVLAHIKLAVSTSEECERSVLARMRLHISPSWRRREQDQGRRCDTRQLPSFLLCPTATMCTCIVKEHIISARCLFFCLDFSHDRALPKNVVCWKSRH